MMEREEGHNLSKLLLYRPGLNMDCEHLDLEAGICRYLEDGRNMPQFYDGCRCLECLIALSRISRRA